MSTARVIWQLITYRPWVYLTTTIFWIGFSLMELVPGLLAKAFFDTLTGSAPLALDVEGIIVLILVAAGVHMILLVAGLFFDVRSRFFISMLLRRNLLSRLLDRPGAQAIPGSTGEAISTFRDDAHILEEASDWLIDTIAQAVYLPVALLIMVRISPSVTALTVIPLIAVLLITRVTTAQIERYRTASRQATEHVTGALGELMNAVQAIQVATAEEFVRDYVAELNERRRIATVKDSLLQQILESIFEHSATLGTGLVLIVAAGAMQSGRFTVGDFALFVAYLQSLSVFTTQFGMFLTQFKQARISFDRMVALACDTDDGDCESTATAIVAHTPVSLTANQPPAPPPTRVPADRLETLEVRGLTYHYPGADDETCTGIEDVSFTLKQGQFVVVCGRVGAGKTTLLRALLGLLPHSAGHIVWNGRPVSDPATFFVPPRSAYTPQVPHLFSTTLRTNILLGLPDEDGALSAAVKQAVLEYDVANMPAGLDTLVGPNGMRLSGGQIQRTAAARMFVRRPELLIFDDLSSALDARTERTLWKRLFSGAQQDGQGRRITCLAVSHRWAALRRADHIIVLKDGQVETEGSLEDVLRRSTELQHLQGTEIRE